MDAIYPLTENIVRTGFSDLPPEVIEATKKLILDSIAVSLGGSAKEGVKALLDLLEDWGGKQESTVWVYGKKLPSVHAVQVNAFMIHAMDYDDTHDVAILHAGATAVPTAFALAENVPGIDGQKVITAIALAVDLTARLCLANQVSMFESGWHYSALHGTFNSAAVAGKLLGLNVEQMVNAFGLAYHQAAGNYQGQRDGTLAKRAGIAFAARNGVTAALMAQRGITGARNVLQGRYGLFNVYHGGKYDPEVLTADLGRKNEILNLSFKPYACARGSHPSIDATLELVRQTPIKPEDIDHVVVSVDEGITKLLCEPLEAKQTPNQIDVQFSIPWAVASAIVEPKISVSTFTIEATRNNKILELSRRVFPKVDPSLNRMGVGPAIVEIKMKDGRTFSKRVDVAYGSPQRPMSMDAVAVKLKDCAARAAIKMNEKNVEVLADITTRFEELKEASSIVKLLI